MSPLGSHENLTSPQSPESQRSDWSRKGSVKTDSNNRRISMHEDQEQKQSTSDMFKDMLSQKRNMLISKLTSFDSDVSEIQFEIFFSYVSYCLSTIWIFLWRQSFEIYI